MGFGARRFFAGGLQLFENFAANTCVFFCSNGLDRSEKPVAPPRQSLHKSRVVGRVIESPTKPLDGRVKAMFKIPIGVSGPESPVKFFARNELTRILEKADKNMYRLPLKTDFAALLPEFARTHVKFENPKSDGSGRWHNRSH
jgi:hypothetical protein